MTSKGYTSLTLLNYDSGKTGQYQRKSKARPDPQLSDAQKEDNRTLAKLRVFVEHAIGGMKRYRILVNPYRNYKPEFEDDVAVVSAGLWNFLLR